MNAPRASDFIALPFGVYTWEREAALRRRIVVWAAARQAMPKSAIEIETEGRSFFSSTTSIRLLPALGSAPCPRNNSIEGH